MKKRRQLVSLLDFVPAATPRFTRPVHLAPLVDLIERTRCEPVLAVVAKPPRHAGSETLQHGVAWRLIDDPRLRVAYVTYGQRFSERRSKRIRDVYQRVGGPLDPESKSKADWRTGIDDGGVWATSVGGPITGEGFHVIFVDDPTKDRAAAESAIEREKLYDYFTDTLYTRLEPGGSVIVLAARWHEDDLSGRLIRDGWQYLNLPALDDQGNALWSERWPADKLREIEETIGEYAFASLYLGRPMTRGSAVFRDVHHYDQLPQHFRIGKGIDVAYTGKTRADKSAAVVLLESEGLYYVVDVRRESMQVPDFMRVLATIDYQWRGPWHWYTSTTEAGLAHLATAVGGVTVLPERATVDKYQRAQPIAAAWNAARVLLPRSAPWLDAFLAEVLGFTGVNDRHDDMVDALSSAFARLGGALSMGGRTTSQRAMAIRAGWTQGLGGFVHGGREREPAPRLDQGGHTVAIPQGPGQSPQTLRINYPSSPVGFGGGGGGGGRGWGSGGGIF